MKNLTLEELHPLIIEWAAAKDLLKEINAPSQRLKLIEECGELSSAILKSNVELQKDAIGDIFVVLVILYKQINRFTDFMFPSTEGFENIHFFEIIFDLTHRYLDTDSFYDDDELGFNVLNVLCLKLNLDLEECANLAWNQIKNRTGKTINGSFIKD